MEKDQVFRLVSAFCETALSIPILASYFLLLTFWTPLVLMVILHTLTIVYSFKNGRRVHILGSVLGIFASIFAFDMAVGWTLHFATTLVLWTTFVLVE